MSWLDDQPSAEFRERVLKAAAPELSPLRGKQVDRRWFWQFAAASGVAALAGVFAFRPGQEAPSELVTAIEALATDPELLSQYEFVQDLELWENLALFEEWPEEDT